MDLIKRIKPLHLPWAMILELLKPFSDRSNPEREKIPDEEQYRIAVLAIKLAREAGVRIPTYGAPDENFEELTRDILPLDLVLAATAIHAHSEAENAGEVVKIILTEGIFSCLCRVYAMIVQELRNGVETETLGVALAKLNIVILFIYTSIQEGISRSDLFKQEEFVSWMEIPDKKRALFVRQLLEGYSRILEEILALPRKIPSLVEINTKFHMPFEALGMMIKIASSVKL